MNVKEAKIFSEQIKLLCKNPELYSVKDQIWYVSEQISDELLDLLYYMSQDALSSYYCDSKEIGDMEYDLVEGTYNGYSIDDIENKRKKLIETVKHTRDTFNRIELFVKEAGYIRKWIKEYAFLKEIRNKTKTLVSIDVCSKMFDKNYSITEINEIMDWLTLSDIYGLSIILGKEVVITAEEKEEVKRQYMESGRPEVLEKIFGKSKKQPGKVDLYDLVINNKDTE